MQNRKQGNAQGIDVSRWQGNINWGDVAKSGVSFVFVKATQNKIDPMFIQNITGARKAGLTVGAYHYLDESVTTPAQARAAANKFYTAIMAGGGIDLPPVLDYESKAPGMTPAQATAVALAFLQEIERLSGKLPMLYTYPSFIGNFNGLSAYPLWIARYSASKVPDNAQGWEEWEFWQYSDGRDGGTLPGGGRKVNGIAGPVDLNEFNGTESQLRAKYGKRVKPVKPEKELDIIETVVTYVKGKQTRTGTGLLLDGKNYLPIRELESVLGFTAGFEAESKTATVNGRKVQDGHLIGNTTYVQAAVLVRAFEGELEWNNEKKILTIIKGGK